MKWLKRGIAALVTLAVLAVLAGATWQRWATARDLARFPMPGERVDVGGRALHLVCTGAGDVTLVLENGLTANTATWLLVQPGIAEHTRVCSYDRAGMGWSDPSPDPTRAEFVSRDLARLLAAAAVPPPYVLVGWSAGGVFARRFHHDHPDRVVGLVLVDSSHEQQKLRLPTPLGGDLEATAREQLALCARIAWTGVVRLSGAMARINASLDLPPDVAATLFAMANRTEYCGGVAREIEGFQDDIVASAPPEALDDLPLVVLSRGRPSRAQDFAGAAVTPEYLTDVDRVWAALQAELAGLSTRSVQRVVVDSGHAIPLEAPDAVVDAVRDVLQTSAGSRARAPSAAASQVPSSSE